MNEKKIYFDDLNKRINAVIRDGSGYFKKSECILTDKGYGVSVTNNRRLNPFNYYYGTDETASLEREVAAVELTLVKERQIQTNDVELRSLLTEVELVAFGLSEKSRDKIMAEAIERLPDHLKNHASHFRAWIY